MKEVQVQYSILITINARHNPDWTNLSHGRNVTTCKHIIVPFTEI